MKRDVFSSATIKAALNALKQLGATIPTETEALANEKKADVIISKFTNSPKCFDGYCIRETPKNVIEALRKEFPNEDLRMFKYTTLICIDCKDDNELMKGLGF